MEASRELARARAQVVRASARANARAKKHTGASGPGPHWMAEEGGEEEGSEEVQGSEEEGSEEEEEEEECGGLSFFEADAEEKEVEEGVVDRCC